MKVVSSVWILLLVVTTFLPSIKAGEAPLWTELPAVERSAPIEGAVCANRFSKLAEVLSPAVVHISVTQRARGRTRRSTPFGAPYGTAPKAQKNTATGTGFMIRSDGFIVTNNHVVENADSIRVILVDDREFTATLIGADPATDLALIKIAVSAPLPVAPLGDSEEIRIGDWVIAIGNPFGLDHTVTAGIVSAKGRKEVMPGRGPIYANFIQTDASINPGNSGGPLINMRGEVIGINTAVVASGQGIGFSIPINMVKKLLPQLAQGKIQRAYLGVYLQSVTRQIAQALGLEKTNGALISKVFPNSPADKGGLEAGDVVVAFDGKEIETSSDLAWMSSVAPIGSKVSVSFLREGTQKEASVVMALHPDDEAQAEGKETTRDKGRATPLDGIGAAVTDLPGSLRKEIRLKPGIGALVDSVEPGGPASKAGLRAGDIILRLGYKIVKGPGPLSSLCKGVPSGRNLSFHIMRGDYESWIAMKKD